MIEKKFFPKISTNWPNMANLAKVAKFLKVLSRGTQNTKFRDYASVML